MRPPHSPAVPPVPIQEAVADFASALVGLGAAASKVQPSKVEADGSHVVALYRDDIGRAAVLVIADLAFAAASGAALAMIPATTVKETLGAGRLSDTLLENFREVANVTASLINSPTTPHVTLTGVWASDDPALPEHAWGLLAHHTKRREFAVTIEGYGSGRFGIVIG